MLKFRLLTCVLFHLFSPVFIWPTLQLLLQNKVRQTSVFVMLTANNKMQNAPTVSLPTYLCVVFRCVYVCEPVLFNPHQRLCWALLCPWGCSQGLGWWSTAVLWKILSCYVTKNHINRTASSRSQEMLFRIMDKKHPLYFEFCLLSLCIWRSERMIVELLYINYTHLVRRKFSL